MYKTPTVTIDSLTVPIEGERNLLELVRKAKIDLPTFCYHSDISVYGACRMCMVEADNAGILPACSTPPGPPLLPLSRKGLPVAKQPVSCLCCVEVKLSPGVADD